jgi:hypothetical protein
MTSNIPQTLTPEQMEQIAAMREQVGGKAQPQPQPPEEPGVLSQIGDGLEATGKVAFSLVKNAAMLVATGIIVGEMKEGLEGIKGSMNEASAGDNQVPPAAPNNAPASVDNTPPR